ncbi:MAG: hypothetical protein WD055_05090 [Candidatus Dependentiae bacterium]
MKYNNILLLFLFGLINLTINSEAHRTKYGTFDLTLIDTEELEDCWLAAETMGYIDSSFASDSEEYRIYKIALKRNSEDRKKSLLQLLSKATKENWSKAYIDFIKAKLKDEEK